MSYVGIDVSKYQGDIDWTKVRKAGYRYAMIRAVSSNKTGLYVDPYFEKNMRNAKAAGVSCGAYIYSYATNEKEVKKEIDFLLNVLNKFEINMPVAFDYEYEESILALTNEERTNNVRTACEMIEKAGYYAMLYCSCDFLRNKLNASELSDIDVWIAHYGKCEDSPLPVGIHQVSNTGIVPGIKGNVDIDQFYKAYDTFIAPVKLGSTTSGGSTEDAAKTTKSITFGPMSEGDYNTLYKIVFDAAKELGGIEVKEE